MASGEFPQNLSYRTAFIRFLRSILIFRCVSQFDSIYTFYCRDSIGLGDGGLFSLSIAATPAVIYARRWIDDESSNWTFWGIIGLVVNWWWGCVCMYIYLYWLSKCNKIALYYRPIRLDFFPLFLYCRLRRGVFRGVLFQIVLRPSN